MLGRPPFTLDGGRSLDHGRRAVTAHLLDSLLVNIANADPWEVAHERPAFRVATSRARPDRKGVSLPAPSSHPPRSHERLGRSRQRSSRTPNTVASSTSFTTDRICDVQHSGRRSLSTCKSSMRPVKLPVVDWNVDTLSRGELTIERSLRRSELGHGREIVGSAVMVRSRAISPRGRFLSGGSDQRKGGSIESFVGFFESLFAMIWRSRPSRTSVMQLPRTGTQSHLGDTQTGPQMKTDCTQQLGQILGCRRPQDEWHQYGPISSIRRKAYPYILVPAHGLEP